MTVKLKTITPTSWLVIGDTDETRIGLLTEIREQYILMAQGVKKSFLNRKEVNKYFEENIFDNVMDAAPDPIVDKNFFINGYPVDFDSPNEVMLVGNKLPLFSKKATSDVYYRIGCLRIALSCQHSRHTNMQDRSNQRWRCVQI